MSRPRALVLVYWEWACWGGLCIVFDICVPVPVTYFSYLVLVWYLEKFPLF